MNSVVRLTAIAAVVLACVSGLQAQIVIETVIVGNPGNGGEYSGESEPGGFGADRVCGATGYVYSIGKFEVTAGEYAEFLNAVAATDTFGLYNASMDSDAYGCQITESGDDGSYTYDFSGRPSGTEADWGDRPMNYTSWGDAARFCNWLHNGQPGLDTPVAQDESSTEDGSYFLDGATLRAEFMSIVREPDATWVIPSEDEWYKAAYYDGGSGVYYDYPTGTNDVPSNVLSDPDPGNNANFNDSGYTIGSPYYRTMGGDLENSASPYGTFDQGGNVWEWNEAVLGGSVRGLRGGSFDYLDYFLHAVFRYYRSPIMEHRYIGFRVANVSAECSNGLVEYGEVCDDNNSESGDGCSSTCTVEDGWDCTSEPSECALTCGDGVIDTHDECDDGDTEGGDGCSSTCTVEDGFICQGEPSVCFSSDIPAVSQWGLVVMTLLVLAAGSMVLARRRAVAVGG